MTRSLAALTFLLLALAPATREQQQSSVMTIALPVTVVIPNAGASWPLSTQGGTTYTLQASDNGSVVVFTSASPVTVTVPSGLGGGFNVTLLQAGAGVVTPVAAAGSAVSIHQRLFLTKTAGQWALISLLASSADTFVLSGDLQ